MRKKSEDAEQTSKTRRLILVFTVGICDNGHYYYFFFFLGGGGGGGCMDHND